MAPKIAVVYYSMYGHIKALADAEVRGIEAAGGKADVFQIGETLPQDVLEKMHAPAKDSSISEFTPDIFESYDGVLLGIPTRYGNFPAQWKTFWDKCGKQWASGALQGKFAGLFISTATMGGGQESTALAAMSTLAHLGIIYVPLGYAKTPQLLELDEVRGGSPWGAGTFSNADGSRQPSKKELAVAEAQGKYFYETVGAEVAGRAVRSGAASGAAMNNDIDNTGASGNAVAAQSEVGPQPGQHGVAGAGQPTAGAAADRREAEQVAGSDAKEKKTVCGIPVSSKCVVS